MKEDGINDELLHRFSNLIRSHLGICISPEKQYMLKAKLIKIAEKIGHQSIASFYDEVLKGNKDALDILIENVTITHSYFFREHDHLDLLYDDIRTKALAGSEILIWCAGASSGEEVYSIAIALLEYGITNFIIMASDINKSNLHVLNDGVYSSLKLQYAHEKLLAKYFNPMKNGFYKIKPFIRKHIRIKQLNLTSAIEFNDKFEYIFCRNVMIYFDKEVKEKVLDMFEKNLKPGGLLFIGHTESLYSLKTEFEPFKNSVYRKAAH